MPPTDVKPRSKTTTLELVERGISVRIAVLADVTSDGGRILAAAHGVHVGWVGLLAVDHYVSVHMRREG